MAKYSTVLSLLLIACLTQNSIKSEVCKALCRRDGYDSGTYIKRNKSCACGDIKSYKEITDKVIKVRPEQHIPLDDY